VSGGKENSKDSGRKRFNKYRGGDMKKILGIFFSPKEVFVKLNDKPDWIVPVVVTILVSLIFTMIVLPRVIVPEQTKRIMEMDRLTEAQKERATGRLEGAQPYITTPIGIIVFSFILIFIKSGILFLIFSLFGEKTVFKKVLAIVSYSFLIGVPEVILKTSLMLIKGSTRVYTGLALLATNLDIKSPIFRLLARIDIFTIWHLCLISLGLAVIYKINNKKSFAIVFGLWLLWILLQFGLAFVLPKGLFFG
jgi:hypothetical protein